MGAIGWHKRSFPKYFDKEDNFTEFHYWASRLLEAPTIKVTWFLQDSIEQRSQEIGEQRASEWCRIYWCWDHGDYTNATAGYVRNNKSTGIESHWRYMKRDAIGSAGSNKRISLKVVVPSLTQYLSGWSKRNTSKILDEVTGAHRFPSEPKVGTKLWGNPGKIQNCRVTRLHLSVCDASAAAKLQWHQFFHRVELDRQNGQLTDYIQAYSKNGQHMRLARSSLGTIIMPSEKFMKIMDTKGYRNFVKVERAVEAIREEVKRAVGAPYEVLFHDTDTIFTHTIPKWVLKTYLTWWNLSTA
jgi:hypothetical protein